jgi:peptidyl-tRNA hydrolase, PTH1 family
MTENSVSESPAGSTSRPGLPPEPYLIVGLGNPGRDYKKSRHNLGFMTLDKLAERLDVRFTRVQNKTLVTDARYAERRLVLAKPQTYMNLSGQAVGSLVRFYKIPIEQFMVVYDDIDLPTGSLRMRPGGGSGGHRGLKSIIQGLGSEEFPRLRLGVGRPPGRLDPANYVLQNFDRTDGDLIVEVLNLASDAILEFIKEGIQQAMTRYNRREGD